jgi:cytochrome o ubiquinol oxidase operon protein cyoD
LAGQTLVLVIVGLAVVQLLVQLIFFLHLGKESKPRLNLTIFAFMLLVVGIVAIGSLWIMHNLDYNMMPKEMNEHMLDQYDKGGI